MGWNEKEIVSDKPAELSREEIARCAFLIFERDGCPEGRDLEHWYQAEAQLRAMAAHNEVNGSADGAKSGR